MKTIITGRYLKTSIQFHEFVQFFRWFSINCLLLFKITIRIWILIENWFFSDKIWECFSHLDTFLHTLIQKVNKINKKVYIHDSLWYFSNRGVGFCVKDILVVIKTHLWYDIRKISKIYILFLCFCHKYIVRLIT